LLHELPQFVVSLTDHFLHMADIIAIDRP